MNEIYETPTLVVFTNDSGEIFIKNKISKLTLRVGDFEENLRLSFYNQDAVLISSSQFLYTLIKNEKQT